MWREGKGRMDGETEGECGKGQRWVDSEVGGSMDRGRKGRRHGEGKNTSSLWLCKKKCEGSFVGDIISVS